MYVTRFLCGALGELDNRIDGRVHNNTIAVKGRYKNCFLKKKGFRYSFLKIKWFFENLPSVITRDRGDISKNKEEFKKVLPLEGEVWTNLRMAVDWDGRGDWVKVN